MKLLSKNSRICLDQLRIEKSKCVLSVLSHAKCSHRAGARSLFPLRLLFFNSHPIFFFTRIFVINPCVFVFFSKACCALTPPLSPFFPKDSLSLASASEYFSYFIHLYDAFQVINKLRNSCHKLVIEILCNIFPITYFLLSRPFELRC